MFLVILLDCIGGRFSNELIWILFLFQTIITKPTISNWKSNNFYWTVHYVKTLSTFIDKHLHVSLHTHTYISQNRKWVKQRHLLPAGKPKQFSIHVTGLIVEEAPKSLPIYVCSQPCSPLMGSVGKTPSGCFLTGTRSLCALNGKDLLNTALVSQSHPSPRGQGAEVLGRYGNYKVNQWILHFTACCLTLIPS